MNKLKVVPLGEGAISKFAPQRQRSPAMNVLYQD